MAKKIIVTIGRQYGSGGRYVGKLLAEKLGIPAAPMESLWRASEDFGQYLKECPGAMFYLGAGEKGPALHTDAYDFNDRLLETAVNVFAALATDR